MIKSILEIIKINFREGEILLYYTGLEDIIFSKHELLSEEPDELIIISGYLGPSPVDRLSELPNMKIIVIGGMYPAGVDTRLYNSLEKIKQNNPNLGHL